MAIALGIGQRSVDVENQRLEHGKQDSLHEP